MHGLRRAVRRGLSNIRIQSLLTATVINLKRMAKAAQMLLRAVRLQYAALKRWMRIAHTHLRAKHITDPHTFAILPIAA